MHHYFICFRLSLFCACKHTSILPQSWNLHKQFLLTVVTQFLKTHITHTHTHHHHHLLEHNIKLEKASNISVIRNVNFAFLKRLGLFNFFGLKKAFISVFNYNFLKLAHRCEILINLKFLPAVFLLFFAMDILCLFFYVCINYFNFLYYYYF